MSTYLNVGDTVKAGQYLLLSSGEYSDYSINGLYRAKVDFVIPGIPTKDWSAPDRHSSLPDIHAISINVEWVEELDYVEICNTR